MSTGNGFFGKHWDSKVVSAVFISMNIKLLTEDGENAVVEFEITENAGAEDRCFGISATMTIDGSIAERSAVEERFFTRDEAEKTVAMLCKYQVTPCTLCDVL